MPLNQMYTDLILKHNKKTENRREIDYSHHERGHNPSCGDDLTLLVKLKDGKIEDASYVGYGCAISQASISMMIDLVKGKTQEEAQRLVQNYLAMIQGQALSEDEMDELGESLVFESLKDVPARVKCATLGWHCLRVILEKESV